MDIALNICSVRTSSAISCGKVILERDKILLAPLLTISECPLGPPIKNVRSWFVSKINLENCFDDSFDPSSETQIV